MANLRPWYTVITPREDLRENRPLDASEFAVHLDQIRSGQAPEVYKNPKAFFERTYLTAGLTQMAAEVLRRFAGIRTETSAVFNMATQFGGGKTHALALLYHLAQHGPAADGWHGVQDVLTAAELRSVPRAATAVFVGTEFDSLTGRGGADGTPLRKTPWGEIAFQLGGEAAYRVVAEHDQKFIEPKGDVIRAFLPKDRPCLILMDEIINYVSTYRRLGYHNALYNFIQSLSETVRGLDNVVLVVSIPATELEYTAEDEADEQRFKKMLDRLSKAVVMSAEGETSEIIRRRLFEWEGLPHEGQEAVAAYADWVSEHRYQLPNWFPVDRAREAFEATYPFHPTAISVFERKWQALPRFQRTRGILRLLALWVARAYHEGFQGAQRDPLIGLGTAPLEDSLFRAAVLEQLGESHLEAAITTDIVGKMGAHALRLDDGAVETIKKARLHRKVATTIFFESNGGQMRQEATVPELRLAVSEPDLDIGNVETALDALASSCYYLYVEGNRYRFGLKPNLNKLLADRRASIKVEQMDERIRTEVEKAFRATGAQSGLANIERILFPERSGEIPDRAALALVVLSPEHSMEDKANTLTLIETLTREHGTSARTFKSALIWAVAESDALLRDHARGLLAWEEIDGDRERLALDDEAQLKQLKQGLDRARRDLKEAVWRSYRNVVLLGKDNALRVIDLGIVNSSAADSLVELMFRRLRADGEVAETISPNFLLRNWPPAFVEWGTAAVRDAFFASPQFPRLVNGDVLKDTIANGVASGLLAYIGKTTGGDYDPFYYDCELNRWNIELSPDMYIIPKEVAERHVAGVRNEIVSLAISPSQVQLRPGDKQVFVAKGFDAHGREQAIGEVRWSATGGVVDADGVFLAGSDMGHFTVTAKAGEVEGSAAVVISSAAPPLPLQPPSPTARISWSGAIPAQKWMSFYMKVLSPFALSKELKITVQFDVSESGLTAQKIEEIRANLRELGLDDDVGTE